jgi:hypothetical protein
VKSLILVDSEVGGKNGGKSYAFRREGGEYGLREERVNALLLRVGAGQQFVIAHLAVIGI